MSSAQKDPIIPPGIKEALHPGLGNGAALEHEKHSLLLRLPDPSKLLEPFLQADQELSSIEKSAENIPGEQTEPKRDKPAKKVTKTVESNDKDLTDNSLGNDSSTETVKAPKPGKRLKKAVKSVQRDQPTQAEDTPMEHKTESSLSPFTSWLKGLSGSEYVHPYDDDYALRQETASPGEGISETYADLLAAQGYKEQALEMYKRLMEKYPEKSGFFAAKIEALS